MTTPAAPMGAAPIGAEAIGAEAIAQTAAEFGLGAPDEVTALPGGGPAVRLTTPQGRFVLKPVREVWELELSYAVAQTLHARNVRQAQLRATPDGRLRSSTGHCVQEWLPGQIADHPTRAQSRSLLAYLRLYDEALAAVPIPPEVEARDTVWTRVVDLDFLPVRLPELLDEAELDPRPVDQALARVAAQRTALDRLPVQLVHGDIGPGNVLWEGDQVVSVIDFTPFRKSRLFAVASAGYWHHVYGRPEPDDDALGEELGPYAEPELGRAAVLAEALRRLATPLEVAAVTGQPPRAASLAKRYQAVEVLAAPR